MKPGTDYRVFLLSSHPLPWLPLLQVFDQDGDGLINTVELRHVIENLGEKLTQNQITEAMTKADTDGDGQINHEGGINAPCPAWLTC